ncbi:N-acetyltransferase eco [Drosophila eugracilis]|uniref:N-acetyltransferase eco n=1 Tax=Drosophila eugracilis TaxID=29029 RepID=UPI0007E76851|nr:N-acetyltransferase eco [Drosophila eugracilis]
METPTDSGSSMRAKRLPTPRLSERKRQLFGSPVSRLRKINDDEDEDVDSLGVLPLKAHVAVNKQAKSLFASCTAISENSSNSSPETNKENKKIRGKRVLGGAAEQLPQLFTATMRLNSNSSSNSRNGSPRTPKTQRKRADSSMSSPTSSSVGSPSPRTTPSTMQENKSGCRRSPRTFSAQKNGEDFSSPETFQKRLCKVAAMIMNGQIPKQVAGTARRSLNHNRNTSGEGNSVKNKRSSLGTSTKRRKSPVDESSSEDEEPPARKISRKNEEIVRNSNIRALKMKSNSPKPHIGTPRSRQMNTPAEVIDTIKSADEVPAFRTKSDSLESRSKNTKCNKVGSSETEDTSILETITVIPRKSPRRTKSLVKVSDSSNDAVSIIKDTEKNQENESRSMNYTAEAPYSDEVLLNPMSQKRVSMDTLPIKVASSAESDSGSPQSKMRKMTLESSIPTMAFYSHSGSTATKPKGTSATSKGPLRRSMKISPTYRPRLGINNGVRHKIRKRSGMSNRMPTSDLDNILNSLNNERLKNLITTKRAERAKVEEVHQILRSARDPIKMAKPLSVIEVDDAKNNNNMPETVWGNTSADFSDLSEDEDKDLIDVPAIELEPIIPIIRHEPTHILNTAEPPDLSKRKFFKSGRRSSTCMEVRITDNIRASVSQGKIALVQTPRRKPRQVRVKSSTIFSAEQATVDAILKNLDDTVIDEIVESKPLVESASMKTEDTPMEMDPLPDIIEYAPETYAEIDPFAEFRQRLPYQTNDPDIVEQQKILLEFLISNNICTEENFEIFIANPDNHKEEANRIVDDLYMVVNSEEAAYMAQTEALPEPVLDVPPQQNPPVTEEVQPRLFPIFTQRLQPVAQKSTRRRPDTSMKLISAAGGSSQYQIDAGQKAFGARQCQQCGLVYTVHEPEEEQLHREYHNSIHVLRFKGWIDEDIVSVYPEWASDGRILRITERAPAARLERLRDLIGVVDKELGYSSYIVPKIFVAFIAVRKQQIVGFCLVQPLSQAHRFIQVDGIDYFSEESYPATCGISRIWVSPLHRRCGIAKKLLRVVQCHTVIGQEISKDSIAFSTPTDDGRALARQFTGLDNFLTYDQ